MSHTPVLIEEVVHGLDPKDGQIIVDGTVGNGGHAKRLVPYIGKEGVYVGIDQDTDALANAEKALSQFDARIILVENNFRNIHAILDEASIPLVDGILLDIGTRMDQIVDSGRGFTFTKDEPLMMTFKKNPHSEDVTAHEIVNTWGEESIRDILFGYGDERYAKRIAKAIVSKRKKGPIQTTWSLISILDEVLPPRYKKGKTHFATKTFQALRVAVNDEIEALREGIKGGFERLNKGGRMAVISFHSTEDRVVKRYFRDLSSQGLVERVTKKPIVPTQDEIQNNPASRSAKLRIIKKI